MSTILVVEGDPRVREAVRRALVSAPSTEALALIDVGSLAQARDVLAARSPELLVLAPELPDGDGLRLLRETRRRRAPPVAVVHSTFDDDRHIFEALRAGAVGYLLVGSSDEQFRFGIAEALAGGAPMSPAIARRVVESFWRDVAALSATPTELTQRELEVTELLAVGETYDGIGHALGISTNTVRGFIRSIYEKLGVSTKVEAVTQAGRRGLLRRG